MCFDCLSLFQRRGFQKPLKWILFHSLSYLLCKLNYSRVIIVSASSIWIMIYLKDIKDSHKSYLIRKSSWIFITLSTSVIYFPMIWIDQSLYFFHYTFVDHMTSMWCAFFAGTSHGSWASVFSRWRFGRRMWFDVRYIDHAVGTIRPRATGP